jgi:hypothetical protein
MHCAELGLSLGDDFASEASHEEPGDSPNSAEFTPNSAFAKSQSSFRLTPIRHEKTAEVCTWAVQFSRTAHPFQTAARTKPRRAVDLVERIRLRREPKS